VSAGPTRRRVLQGAAAAALLPRAARAGRRHVVVVGGGPAGLSAAVELVEAGLAVTLCEATDRLGGKARGWTLKEGGRRRGAVLEMEHGAHAVGVGDAALLSLLSRYGLDGALGEPVLATPQPEPPGWRRTLRVAARGEGDRASAALIAAGRYLAASEPAVADPAAAAWIAGGARYLAGTAGEWLWEPLGDVVRGFGGVVRLSTRVRGLRVEGGACTGVRLGLPAARLRVEDGALGSVVGEERSVFVQRVGGGLVAVRARCTHDGATLVLSEGRLCCPRDGSCFALDGAVAMGPAVTALPPLPVRRVDAGVDVELPETAWDVGADAVVLAVDLPSAQRLAGDLVPALSGLQGSGYAVARFWLDRDVAEGRPTVGLLSGTARRGLLLHRLQERAAIWADRVSMAPRAPLGSVIELQAAAVPPTSMAARVALLDELEAALWGAWPELAGARIHARTLVAGDGLWAGPAAAVGVQAPVAGLLLAGDYVQLPGAGALMERAVATGRAAAVLAASA